MTFPARYPGRCAADCDERIHEGDLVRMTDEGVVHANCDEVVLVVRPEPAPCGVCWLTHPEGACDR